MAEGHEPQPNSYSNFEVTAHVLDESLTLSANDTKEYVNVSVTKTGGWYPLAITGYSYTGWATQYVYPFSIVLRDRQVGSAGVIFRLKNNTNSEISINSVCVYILWMKA